MQTSLIISIVVFLVFLMALERLHSIKTIIRLLISLGLFYGYIRAVSDGQPIIWFSLLFIVCLTFCNTLIKDGLHRKTFSEMCAVLITSIFTSQILFFICKSIDLNVYKEAIKSFNGVKNPENAIISVFMIATLGIYMDIISRIIYLLDEEKDKTITVSWKEQLKKGIKIGREIIHEKFNMILIFGIGMGIFPILRVFA